MEVKKEILDDFFEITENEIFQLQIDFKIKTEREYDVPDKKFTVAEEISNINCSKVGSYEKLEYYIIKCPLCDEAFSNEHGLLVHNLQHIVLRLERLYECNHCSQHYIDKSRLESHIKLKHIKLIKKNKRKIRNSIISKISSLHKCSVCSKVMPYRRWHEHTTQVHPTDSLTFRCYHCSQTFKCKRYLTKHIYKHHTEKKKPKKSVSLKEIIPKDKAQCDVCMKTFRHRNNLQVHRKTVHCEASFICDLCGAEFKCETYMRTHKNRVHYDDGKDHHCKICDKRFSSPRRVRIHMSNCHSVKRLNSRPKTTVAKA